MYRQYTLCMLMNNDRVSEAHCRRTSDMLLLRGGFFRICSLLDVHNQLGLSLVLVDWPGWVVNLVAIYVIPRLPGSLAREPDLRRFNAIRK